MLRKKPAILLAAASMMVAMLVTGGLALAPPSKVPRAMTFSPAPLSPTLPAASEATMS